jgi:hypothetical protein
MANTNFTISALFHLARAVELEPMLVPREYIVAVEAMIRTAPARHRVGHTSRMRKSESGSVQPRRSR